MVWHKLEERRDSETSLIIYADMERTEFWDLTHRRSSHHTVPLDFPFRSPSAPSLFLKHRLTGQWHMKYRDDTEKRIIAELGNVFSASVETLVIRGMANQVGLETWVRMLAAFPNVKSLEIMGGTPCDFPPAFEPTQTGTPCACLRELDLRYRLYRPRDIHDVEDMLQELRAALQKRIEVDGGLRLESLSLLLERTDNAKPFPSTSVIDKLPAGFRDTLRGLETVVGVLVFRCVAVEREESLWQRRRRK
ncbi:uncharacterized protein B0H18DRAFT_992018, partial [Fomitopsis serialis]|uniref:uncharacterized protein n=1 Tax=Fomitopsis serialis TaxID=139415 RepID=UPI002007B32D